MTVEDSLSLILPVLNERDNLPRLLGEFDAISHSTSSRYFNEVVFVDDGSKDGTVEFIKNESKNGHPYSIKLIERNKKMGQVDACIEGCYEASNEYVLFMDADLQHPPRTIVEMASNLRSDYDFVVASRHVKGGANIWSPLRGVISRTAILLSKILIPPSRGLKDPTSGFFIIKKKYVKGLKPLPKCSKLLLYALATHYRLNGVEIPYVFVDRAVGSSKTVTGNMSFMVNYLIEIVVYMKRYRAIRKVALSRIASYDSPGDAKT